MKEDRYNQPLPSKLAHATGNVILQLIKNHQGRKKAIKSTAIVEELNTQCVEIDIRRFRQLISMLRLKGEPICSGSNGYYFVDEEIEFLETIQSLTDRIKAIAAELVAMRRKYIELYGKAPDIDYNDLQENIEILLSIAADDEESTEEQS